MWMEKVRAETRMQMRNTAYHRIDEDYLHKT